MIPEMDSWIVGADFNNIEALENQQGRGPNFAGIAYGVVGVGVLSVRGRREGQLERAFLLQMAREP